MAFTDPKTVTINSIAKILPRVSVTDNRSVYSLEEPTGSFKLTVSHQYGKRKRSMLRLDVSKIAVDPLIAAQSIMYSSSYTLTADRPLTGFTIAEQKLDVDGLLSVLTAASGADTTKFLGGEN